MDDMKYIDCYNYKSLSPHDAPECLADNSLPVPFSSDVIVVDCDDFDPLVK